MNYLGWKIGIVVILTCALGINYTLYEWLSFDVLGITSGSFLLNMLQVWGYAMLLLSALLVLTLAMAKKMNIKIIDKQLEVVLVLVFVLQLPLISLWFMALFMQGKDAWLGAILHHLLLALAIYCYWQHQLQTEQQARGQNQLSNQESFCTCR